MADSPVADSAASSRAGANHQAAPGYYAPARRSGRNHHGRSSAARSFHGCPVACRRCPPETAILFWSNSREKYATDRYRRSRGWSDLLRVYLPWLMILPLAEKRLYLTTRRLDRET